MAKKNYIREHYEKYADNEHLDWFYKYIDELESIVAEQGWNLEKRCNGNWYSFKHVGKREVAFRIGLEHKNLIYLYIKRVKSEVDKFPVRMWRYVEIHEQVEYLLKPRLTELKTFMELLQSGYIKSENVS